jgi:hypothetical protein
MYLWHFQPIFAQLNDGDFIGNIKVYIEDIVSQAGNGLLNAPFFQSWENIWILFAAWAFLFKILWTAIRGFYLPNGSIFKNLIVETSRGIFIVFIVMNPYIIVGILQGFYSLISFLADQTVFGIANQGLDILGNANRISELGAQAAGFDPLGITQAFLWILIVVGIVLMMAIYALHIVDALLYLNVLLPFFARMAAAGMMTKASSGWIWSVANSALEQMLKPILGKVFIWLILTLMTLIADGVLQAKNPAFSSSMAIIFGFLFCIFAGVILQLRVPANSKVLAIGSSGAIRDIAGTGFAAASLATAYAAYTGSKILGGAAGGAARGALGAAGAAARTAGRVPGDVRTAAAGINAYRNTPRPPKFAYPGQSRPPSAVDNAARAMRAARADPTPFGPRATAKIREAQMLAGAFKRL